MGIKEDHRRFRDIVRGKIKENFKKYVTHGEMIGKREEEYVKIPIPQIEIPRFKYGPKESGGVGQGNGKAGDSADPSQGQPGQGQGQAGKDGGEHSVEVEMTIEELADLLGEELQLPRIEPRGKKEIESQKLKSKGIAPVGPAGLRHFKRSFKEALKRSISLGEYDAEDPIIVPIKKDFRYRSFKNVSSPQANAVVIYMMDVSGSMGGEQKEIVRIESFWINAWLKRHYKGLHTRFIIHDAAAAEVDEQTFFRSSEAGGTLISSAYNLCKKIMTEEYPASEWNVYCFHFSDGDNWSSDDTKLCIKLLQEDILPRANMFGYAQVESKYGSGQFLRDLEKYIPDHKDLILSQIASRDKIIDSIKEFLGKGK